MDSRKSVGLPEAPQPGSSVSQDVFVGEECDLECVGSKLAWKMMTKCTAENQEAESESRENIKSRKVVEIIRTERARERTENLSTGTLSLEQNNSISRHSEGHPLAPNPGETSWV